MNKYRNMKKYSADVFNIICRLQRFGFCQTIFRVMLECKVIIYHPFSNEKKMKQKMRKFLAFYHD